MNDLAGRRFWPLHIIPAQIADRVAVAQVPTWPANLVLLRSHIVKHFYARSPPSPKCVLYISALCALAPSVSGLGLEGTDRTAESRHMEHGIAEEPHRNQTPTTASSEFENGNTQSQEPPQLHEDVGGGYALSRTMSETVSEYTCPSSMPSPRLGVL